MKLKQETVMQLNEAKKMLLCTLEFFQCKTFGVNSEWLFANLPENKSVFYSQTITIALVYYNANFQEFLTVSDNEKIKERIIYHFSS